MKIRYKGPIDAVEIDLPRGRTVTVRRGETVDVPDVVAVGDGTPGTGFLAQTDAWEEVIEKAVKAGKGDV